MRRGWLIIVLLLLWACSDPPMPATPDTEVVEEAPASEESGGSDNTTFLPAIEMSGSDEEAAAEDDAAVEESAEAYPVPTPEPISPRPAVVAETGADDGTVSAEAVEPDPDNQETTYTIQRGDILGFIARDYGISVNELMEANGITDPNRIEVGQVLVIPSSETGEVAPAEDEVAETTDEPDVAVAEEGDDADEPAEEETVTEEDAPEVVVEEEDETGEAPQTYVVQAGDSLGKIAERFGIPLRDLAAANGLSVTSFVYVDQVLVISAEAPTNSSELNQTYVVQSGDTLRIIANRFGITINSLSAANAITNPNTIFVGQVLVIPNQ